MNVKILEESTTRHHEFPITSQKCFWLTPLLRHLPQACILGHGAISWCCIKSTEGQWEYLYSNVEEANPQIRPLGARGLKRERLAFVSLNIYGAEYGASGISWRKEDNVVIADGDFPSNIYPWLNLRQPGRKGEVYS